MKQDYGLKILFTKKYRWLKEVIEAEAAERGDRERNALVLESLEKVFIDKKPKKR